ncbi:Metal-dependent hydrolase, endonuclease/exonuclease/phosphatase family [Desulfonatronum thiosulfatophilum]|uniref:Metal-dependent hydrolase, endonuclease/exonuclease/phosphatase family n=1 Tax=Desulfonatronum thiosulfatophilum TaxID=617002 RepID=A0A1G6CL53_9BACT|nr:endonuclease/exonuclease/phosphatase family protein [Desulfonatronum thiosulfatophilum]SDB33566.1 Metal-dependent hydrolase, endonuclease/exonuclease/phosphatase family [Desulfonatronum thiosulfatophilum]
MSVPLLTAATYNVHQWVGMDSFYDPFRGLKVLKELAADVIGLQEVNFPKHIKHKITPSILAEELDMQLVVGKTLMRKEAFYGNVLLTNLPIQNVRRHDISVGSNEPRAVLDVDLQAETGLIRVLNTHFGLRFMERRRQHQRLLEILEEIDQRETTILMGDFNEWLPLCFPFRKIMSIFKCLHAPRSFPTYFPLLALDRILVAPAQSMIEIHVHKSRLAKITSDHYPVVATIKCS